MGLERVVIFNDGLPRRAYGPGRFRLWGRGLTEQRFRTEEILLKALPEVRAILPKQWYAEANLGAEQRGVIFLEGVPVGVKDIVLPGEMKVILNRVIEAEKEALANVILRREEVAATRSLANTARVLADNPVLLRLKEFDALKEITAKIGEVKVVVGADNPSAPLNVRRFKAPRTLWPFATFALAALLMLSNAAWAYHVLDASVTNT